jgi:probable F420-dependent oxidoreductase
MTTQNYVRAEFPIPPRFWEPLMVYAFVLSNTKTLKVGTGILVLPMRRDIVVTAKQIATLDHFGKGRLEIGVGIGAYREEFKALQPDCKLERGDIVEEGLQALRLLFSERVATFEGKYYRFKDVELYPKTYQKRIPIYVGGNNANNVRRAVAWGDGWLPAGIEVDRLGALVIQMRQMAQRAGRDPNTIEVAPQFVVHLGKTREAARARYRESQMSKHLTSLSKSTLKEQTASSEDINLIGSVEEVIEKAMAFRKAGVTHFLGLYFAANSADELVDQMQMFAEEVMPKIRG